MKERYLVIKKIIDDWFELKLKLSVSDIMPHMVFLYEENKRLRDILEKEKSKG